MIIWGSKGCNRTVARGEFFCPSCQSARPYRQVRVSRFFTLYFIPIFPLERLAEFVECGGCRRQYDVGVIGLTEEHFRHWTAPWPCEACGNVNAPSQEQCLNCQAARAA